MATRRKRDKLWAFWGIIVFLLVNCPLLEIFNRNVLLGGIPVLVLYLHGVWLAAILGLYFLASRLTNPD